jgi:hypothetical protein
MSKRCSDVADFRVEQAILDAESRGNTCRPNERFRGVSCTQWSRLALRDLSEQRP